MDCGALCYVLWSVRGTLENGAGDGKWSWQSEYSGKGGGLDGVRTEVTPQPSKIYKWTKALDGTSPESETCSRLTRAGVNLQ